jgi:hypothetical protein
MRSTVVLLVAGLALSAVSTADLAEAKPPVSAKGKGGKAEPPPTTIDKKVKLSPDGLRFGMTIEEISKLYEKVFDDEFVPLYKAVEPGPRMAELDSELADKKQLILRNKVEFGSLPSGLDNTSLAGEYSYNNGETMTKVKLRSGAERHFFFFGNHLWKVYEVQKLSAKNKLGADFDAVLGKLTKSFVKGPRTRKADPSAGRNFDQVDWQDKETIVRLGDLGGGKAALIYVDRKIEENLDKYRSNKAPPVEALDHDVSDVTKPAGPDVPPTPAQAAGKKAK